METLYGLDPCSISVGLVGHGDDMADRWTEFSRDLIHHGETSAPLLRGKHDPLSQNTSSDLDSLLAHLKITRHTEGPTIQVLGTFIKRYTTKNKKKVVTEEFRVKKYIFFVQGRKFETFLDRGLYVLLCNGKKINNVITGMRMPPYHYDSATAVEESPHASSQPR